MILVILFPIEIIMSTVYIAFYLLNSNRHSITLFFSYFWFSHLSYIFISRQHRLYSTVWITSYDYGWHYYRHQARFILRFKNIFWCVNDKRKRFCQIVLRIDFYSSEEIERNIDFFLLLNYSLSILYFFFARLFHCMLYLTTFAVFWNLSCSLSSI